VSRSRLLRSSLKFHGVFLKIAPLFIPLLLLAESDFISDYEYGQMLYHNPRGISCAACHGKHGEGKKIVTYKEHNATITIVGPDIRAKSLEEIESIVARNHPIMPKYYLTHEEVVALYNYLQGNGGVEEEEE